MLIEAFLAKIAGAVFKKAMIGGLLKTVATAYEIYSVFDAVSDAVDCVDSANDCADLGVCGVHVASGPLSDVVAERLIGVGSERFLVEQTPSGVYVASSLVPAFRPHGLSMPRISVASSPRIVVPRNPRIRIR